ncbi:MAG: peptidyl-prolyl cis-trans isomerase [Bacteroidales bacterium]|nr:peptidyl-prolyl cis-trans isomerase [Bacteroidales bacterium]
MKRFAVLFALCLGCLLGYAQDDSRVLMTVGNETITVGDFVKAYQKNNLLSEATMDDLREYRELFINYRLKVQEAEAMKLDTSASFIAELGSYESQSAQPYLVDSHVSEELVEEAYERSKSQVRASHILIRCNPAASPKDTLAAYQKIMGIRDLIVNGLDFNEAAALYSEDESAREYNNPQNNTHHYGNKGELGYFSIFEMIYPFETAAFNTPVGSVSMPFRTQFGYHLVYVQDKIPAIGRIWVSQIFVADSTALSGKVRPDIMDRLNDIQAAYNQGVPFDTIAKLYSDDQATKNNGGHMEPFGPSRRPGNYVSAAINARKGAMTAAVPTTIGWHFLRCDSISRATVNEESRYMLKQRLTRDARALKSKEALVERLKKEYNYEESGKAKAFKFLGKHVDANYFQSSDNDIVSIKGIDKLKPICTFADENLTVQEFAKYISRYQGVKLNGTVTDFMEQIYPNFVSENILQYERKHLKEKYPEFRDLVNEFHDGILLYEINTQKVWGAAIQDSVGLEKFYERIKTSFPNDDPDAVTPYKPMSEVRALVITRYQDYLEQEWVKELRAKYAVKVDENVFSSILKR